MDKNGMPSKAKFIACEISDFSIKKEGWKCDSIRHFPTFRVETYFKVLLDNLFDRLIGLGVLPD